MKNTLFSISRPALIAVGLAMSLNCSASLADVVAVVSVKCPVTTLSKEQVTNIFMGKTTLFPDGERALPVDQSEGAASRDEFYSRFAEKSAAQIKAYWSRLIFTGRGQPPKSVLNDSEVKKQLAENPHAIGYIQRDMVDASVRVLKGN
jgi:ABC-type phosphate transport system substrate-binding protein